tara:strand:+ start:46 stop:210 length:165 start_codon:yes stop_codon:yes gene_type:complete
MSEEELKALKEDALSTLRDAEQKMYKYAGACDLGDERTKAFEIYQNIRHAVLVH